MTSKFRRALEMLIAPVVWNSAAAAMAAKNSAELNEIGASPTSQGDKSLQKLLMTIPVIDPEALPLRGAVDLTHFARQVPLQVSLCTQRLPTHGVAC